MRVEGEDEGVRGETLSVANQGCPAKQIRIIPWVMSPG